MTWEIILAVLGVIGAALGTLGWWFKSRQDRENKGVLNGVLEHQENVRLSIREAEKARERGKERTDRILAGTMSRDELNRMRSGKGLKDRL